MTRRSQPIGQAGRDAGPRRRIRSGLALSRLVAVTALVLSAGAGPAGAQFFDPFRPAPAPAPAPAVAAPAPAEAARPRRRERAARASRPAQDAVKTLALIAAEPGGAPPDMAAELCSAVSDERLRVTTLPGGGGARALSDLSGGGGTPRRGETGRGDLGIVTTLDLREAEASQANKRVVAIARLDTMALHVLATGDIRRPADLDGRKVDLGEEGSSTQAMGRALLKELGIRVIEVSLGQRQALERMKAGEAIAASFSLSGKPAPLAAGLTRESGLHFLALAYEPTLDPLFFPAALGPADYPNLIGPGESVETIAVGAALVAAEARAGSDRYRRLSAFTTALFDRFGTLQEAGRHPRWREVNLAAELPGWRRFKPAREILERRRQAQADQSGAAAP